jgi:hypothetical protein
LTLRRVLPSDPADFLRSIVPLALLGLAAVEGSARLAVLLVLVVGTYVATSRNAPVRWAWAAAVPVALALVWGGLISPTIAIDRSSCTDPGSPVAALRAVEAIVVLAAVAGLALWLKANAGTLGSWSLARSRCSPDRTWRDRSSVTSAMTSCLRRSCPP